MTMALAFESLVKFAELVGVDLEGATMSNIGENEVDHHMVFSNGGKKITVIRRKDGNFTNYSEEVV